MKQIGLFGCIVVVLVGFLLCVGRPALAEPSGKVIIFHDESLSVPFKHLEVAVETKYTGLDIQLEAAGSRTCARKITHGKRSCDIVVSADDKIIDDVLIPTHARWNVRFAGNQMVLCYTEKSAHAKEIQPTNWHEILLKRDVTWGHLDPDLDEVGYRALMVLQLAEKQIGSPGLMDRLLASRSMDHVYAGAPAMVTALQDGNLDYGWEYLSVAIQNGLRYIALPDEINLGNEKFASHYQQATVNVAGKTPGTVLILKGRPITYGVCILADAPNKDGAVAFLSCLCSHMGGQMVLQGMGQPVFGSCRVPTEKMKSLLPEKLKIMVEVSP